MPHLHQHRSLTLPAAGIRLAVVADTHSRPHAAALELVAREAPDAVLHAGDIGDLAVLDRLRAAVDAPLIAVRGNIDTRAVDLPDVVTLELSSVGGPSLRILLTHIAVRGPRLRADARRLAEREDAGLVVCGHSHTPLIGRDGAVGIFNPGSIGPRRFRLPITFGVLAVRPDGVRFRHIDCETGSEWHPAPLGAI